MTFLVPDQGQKTRNFFRSLNGGHCATKKNEAQTKIMEVFRYVYSCLYICVSGCRILQRSSRSSLQDAVCSACVLCSMAYVISCVVGSLRVQYIAGVGDKLLHLQLTAVN